MMLVCGGLFSSLLAEANHAAVHKHCFCVAVIAFQDRRGFKLQTCNFENKKQTKKKRMGI